MSWKSSVIVFVLGLTSSIGMARDVEVDVAAAFATEPEKYVALYNERLDRLPAPTVVGENRLLFGGLKEGEYYLVCWSAVGNWAASPLFDTKINVDDDVGNVLRIQIPNARNRVSLRLKTNVDLTQYFEGFSSVPCRIQRYADNEPVPFGYRWVSLRSNGSEKLVFSGEVFDLIPGLYVLSVPAGLAEETDLGDSHGGGLALIAVPFRCGAKAIASEVELSIELNDPSFKREQTKKKSDNAKK